MRALIAEKESQEACIRQLKAELEHQQSRHRQHNEEMSKQLQRVKGNYQTLYDRFQKLRGQNIEVQMLTLPEIHACSGTKLGVLYVTNLWLSLQETREVLEGIWESVEERSEMADQLLDAWKADAEAHKSKLRDSELYAAQQELKIQQVRSWCRNELPHAACEAFYDSCGMKAAAPQLSWRHQNEHIIIYEVSAPDSDVPWLMRPDLP